MALGLIFQFGALFPNLISDMQSMGIFLYLFPFLLALGIFWGVLSFAFKDKMPKQAIILISVILAFFVMLYSSWNVFIVTFFANLGGATLIVATGFLMAAILLGLTGFKITDMTSGDHKWIIIAAVGFLAILIFFGAGASWFNLTPYWSTNSQFVTAIVVIGIIGMAVWWLGKGDEAPKPKGD